MFKKSLIILISLLGCFQSYSQIYRQESCTNSQRADDLLSKMTLEEKITMMMDISKPIDRLSIKGYNWWNEALHGVARNGYATVFPQAIGMAATFDDKALYEAFSAISDEARVKYMEAVRNNTQNRYQGLTFWTPNINIFRDPRWGRGQETYGEDPYLTSLMGVSCIKGLQGYGSDSKYDKLHACAKHFAVHSGPEWNRHTFDVEKLSLRDLYETYLPAFESAVKDADVKEVMCAYNRFEGKPCCGSNRLLTHILRNEWNYKGIIVSDCGAISDFYKKTSHHIFPDSASASSNAVLSGTDLECGGSYKSLVQGVKRGLIDEKDINVSVKRLIMARLELGEMDPYDMVSWNKIPESVLCSKHNDSLALDMARKSMVLLLNKNRILPLKKENSVIAVIGPNANDSIMQMGNYKGTPYHTITILDGIRSAVGNNCKVIYEPACGLVDNVITKSVFNRCFNERQKGFKAEYWNNTKYEGSPVSLGNMSEPFTLCTSGATVFNPGVNLRDFSAIYSGKYKAEESGDIVFDIFLCGKLQIEVNGKEVKSLSRVYGGSKTSFPYHVEKGDELDIKLKFQYLKDDALLSFNLGFKEQESNESVINKVKDADVVIYVGGISPTLEGEQMGINLKGFKGGDRTDIELPQVQKSLIEALHNSNKKVIFVNCSGSAIDLEQETKNCDAIIQAWYPGQSGGKAVADVLFGNYNPSGKLPITFYKNISQLPDYEDYNMKGRTYRYFNGTPLFAFGYGLSYSNFNFGKVKFDKLKIKSDDSLNIKLTVNNKSKLNGDEVLQVYLKKIDDNDGPIKTLRAFKRVSVPSKSSVHVELILTPKQLQWWNTESNSMTHTPGKYKIMIGNSSDNIIYTGVVELI